MLLAMLMVMIQLVSFSLRSTLGRAVRFCFQSDKGKSILEVHGHEKAIHTRPSVRACKVLAGHF